MNKFNELLSKLQNKVNSLLPQDASADIIKGFAEVGEDLKNLEEQYKAQQQENQELKNLVIEQVKHTPVSTKSNEDDGSPKILSLDAALSSALENIKK